MDNVINVNFITKNTNPGFFFTDAAGAPETEGLRTVTDHAAEPIKSLDDIRKVCDFLLQHYRWRDHMLFVCGINFGLRVSDLLKLRFCDLIDEDGCFKDEFKILEQKTSNTRKQKANRRVVLNDAVKNSVMIYLEHTPGIHFTDYLFRSEGNRGRHTGNPLTRMSVDRILKGIAKDCELTNKMSSHSLRKTFGYQVMAMSGNDPRQLLLLQKIFGHSSQMQTLAYIGLTAEEICDTYKELNLGLSYGSVSGPIENERFRSLGTKERIDFVTEVGSEPKVEPYEQLSIC